MLEFAVSERAARLTAFQGELADLAFALDRRGRADAADIARMIATRLDEILAASRDGAADAENRPGVSISAWAER